MSGLIAQSAIAQTSPSNDEVLELEKLEVKGQKVATESSFGTRINTALVETPQSISVVTRAELDARGVQRLTDAVAYSAGVRPESGGIDSRTEYLTIRGYSVSGSGNSYIYLDGLRALTGGGGWTYSSFDTFGLERVEIVKGPAAVLYGQVSPGGIVNVVSKRPTAGQKNSVGVQYSSFNTIQGTVDLSAATQNDKLLVRVVGLARDGEAEIDSTDLRRVFVAPSATWNITDRTSLTFLTQYQKDSGGSTFQFLPRTGTLVAGTNGFYLDQSAFIGEADWNNYDREQYAFGYQFEHKLSDHFIFRNNLRYLASETDYKAVVATGTDANAAGVLARRIMWGFGKSENIIVDTLLESRFDTGPVKHTVLTGVDYYDTQWDNIRYLRATDAINIYNYTLTGVNQTHLAAMLAGAPQVSQDVTEKQLGIYLQEQATWGKLHATAGVRFDSYEMDFLNALNNTRTEVKPDSTTWRSGLIYRFDNGIAPYVSYTTSFDAGPYTTTNPATGRPFEDPTKSKQWELGVKYQPKTFSALFTASAFELIENNRLSYYKDISTNLVYANQSGEARTRGFELEARVELLKGLDVIAGYAYLDAEITQSSIVNNLETLGNRLPGVPNHTGSLWLAYTFSNSALNGLSLGSGVRYVGDTYDNVNNVTKIPEYTLFDASISYDFAKKFPQLAGLSARLSATNVGDKRYIAAANVAPGGAGAAVAYYGSGRNLSLSLRYAW